MRIDSLEHICRQHRIVALYALGSRVEEAEAFVSGHSEFLAAGPSDFDLSVLPRHGRRLPVQEKVELASELEDFFDIGRVDLVVLPEADPFLPANIIRGKRLYADNENLADEYDLYVLRRVGDLIPLERERLALILEGST
jgi:hypothetical protein